MLREGHVGISLLVAAPFFTILLSQAFVPEAIVFAGAIIVGGGFPDADTHIPIVKHRGFLHTVWFAGIFGLLSGLFVYGMTTLLYANNSLVQNGLALADLHWLALVGGLGAAVGVISHLLGDMITPWGIDPLEPVSDKKVKVELTKASNEGVNSVLMALGIASMVIGGAWGSAQLVGALLL